MIYGMGIDLVEVERVADKISKRAGFREFVFSENEIAYCEKRTNKFEHYAARFAAKEAFFKALGTGWRESTAYNEIEVSNDELGKPELNFIGKTAETVNRIRPVSIYVSLSHVKSMATAIVIIENP